jgi:hypothetical protein
MGKGRVTRVQEALRAHVSGSLPLCRVVAGEHLGQQVGCLPLHRSQRCDLAADAAHRRHQRVQHAFRQQSDRRRVTVHQSNGKAGNVR